MERFFAILATFWHFLQLFGNFWLEATRLFRDSNYGKITYSAQHRVVDPHQ